MWEGPSYYPSALEINHETLKTENQSHLEEIQRLRALLNENKIAWAKPPSTKRSILRQSTLLRWTRGDTSKLRLKSTKPLPHLPNEIIIRILGLVVTSPTPIIDPFWKLRPENITKDEKAHASIDIGFLATCKAFKVEGIRLLMANNTFIFTQVAAVQNFAKVPIDLRSTVKNITLRVVGRYYDDISYKKTITGEILYHDAVPYPTVYVAARPKGTAKDKGIQAYCWQQLVDFMKALVVPDPTGTTYAQLLPSIQVMRIDLVNFCEHLPFIGSSFITVLRWHLGKMVDELVITGAPEEEVSNGEERFLAGILRDEGVFASGCPVFVSQKNGLRALPGYGLNLHIVRPSLATPVKPEKARDLESIHPEGGSPPVSIYPAGATIWKYTSDSLAEPEKKWIEFHRRCGYQVSECGELEPDDDSDGEEVEDEWEDDDID
jgi:hypothetical protein